MFAVSITPCTLLTMTHIVVMCVKYASGVKPLAPGRSGQDEVIDKLLKSNIYTRQDPPMLNAGTEVGLGIYVINFHSISEQTLDYSLSFYLRQAWRDPRLQFKPLQNGKVTEIKMEDGWEKIWVPDTFFRNEKDRATYHTVTVPNRMMRVNCTGHVWYVSKISAVFSCPMDLQSFPMDTQVCPMMFESFGYTSDTMYFSWLRNLKSVEVPEELQLPQFKLSSYILKDCSQNYTAGSYSCLSVKFVLERDIGFFLIQVYVPSVLIVILSWVSFWINVEASPARVSIGLLTVLTTTTMSAGARASLPKVSYIKAIDVWMIICLIFVFTSLIEYAVVNVLSRKQARPKKTAGSPTAVKQESELFRVEQDRRVCCPCVHKSTMAAQKPEPDGKMRARNVDKFSRKFFPSAFLLFLVVYCLAYGIRYTEPKLD